MKEIKIMIVDDHKFYRKTLRMILDDIANILVISEASNGQEFLDKYRQVNPDIVFMDIKMPLLNGIEATRIARNEHRDIKIIALTMFEEKEYFLQMMEVGAKGFLLKDAGKDEFSKAIHTVLRGRNYYPQNIATSILFKND